MEGTFDLGDYCGSPGGSRSDALPCVLAAIADAQANSGGEVRVSPGAPWEFSDGFDLPFNVALTGVRGISKLRFPTASPTGRNWMIEAKGSIGPALPMLATSTAAANERIIRFAAPHGLTTADLLKPVLIVTSEQTQTGTPQGPNAKLGIASGGSVVEHWFGELTLIERIVSDTRIEFTIPFSYHYHGAQGTRVHLISPVENLTIENLVIEGGNMGSEGVPFFSPIRVLLGRNIVVEDIGFPNRQKNGIAIDACMDVRVGRLRTTAVPVSDVLVTILNGSRNVLVHGVLAMGGQNHIVDVTGTDGDPEPINNYKKGPWSVPCQDVRISDSIAAGVRTYPFGCHAQQGRVILDGLVANLCDGGLILRSPKAVALNNAIVALSSDGTNKGIHVSDPSAHGFYLAGNHVSGPNGGGKIICNPAATGWIGDNVATAIEKGAGVISV